MAGGGVRLPLELAVTCQSKGRTGPPLQGQTGNLSRGGRALASAALDPPPRQRGTGHPAYASRTTQGLKGLAVSVDPPERRPPGATGRRGQLLPWRAAEPRATVFSHATLSGLRVYLKYTWSQVVAHKWVLGSGIWPFSPGGTSVGPAILALPLPVALRFIVSCLLEATRFLGWSFSVGRLPCSGVDSVRIGKAKPWPIL